MSPEDLEGLARGIWPWLIAGLGAYLLISNGSTAEASDYGFYGWLLGFPFVVEAQKHRNRRNDANGEG